MNNPIIRTCLNCEKPLPPGRTDKRYCDDICRARATRKRNREKYNEGLVDNHKRVIDTIKRNHTLLKKAIGDREEWIVDFEPLYRKGFNRLFYTRCFIPVKGNPRFFCFELGWEDIGDARLLVTVDQEKARLRITRRHGKTSLRINVKAAGVSVLIRVLSLPACDRQI